MVGQVLKVTTTALFGAVVVFLVVVACAARAALPPVTSPVMGMQVQRPVAVDAEAAAAAVKRVVADLQPSEKDARAWVLRVIDAAAALAMTGGAEMFVLRWPELGTQDGAVWMTVRGAGASGAKVMASALGEALAAKAVRTVRGVPLAWTARGEDLVVVIGDAAIAQVETTPVMSGAEIAAHTALVGDCASWVFVDVNALRVQAPRAWGEGPEARLLAALRLSNARAAGLWLTNAKAADGALAGRAMVGAAVTWSARSEALGTVHKGVIAEAAWPARNASPVPEGRGWVMALRTDPGATPIAMGWGAWFRYGPVLASAAEATAAESEASESRQQAWSVKHSEVLRAVSSRLDRWLVVTPGERGVVLSVALRSGSDAADREALEQAVRAIAAEVPGFEAGAGAVLAKGRVGAWGLEVRSGDHGLEVGVSAP